MRNAKRLISCLLIILIFPTATMAEEQEAKAFGTAQELILYNLGIITEQVEGQPDDSTIKIDQFALIVSKLIGIESINFDGTSLNSDTSQRALDSLTSLGIVEEVYDKIEKDSPLLYEQSVAILLNALGYGQYAKLRGEYPLSHITVAKEKGVLKNAVVTLGQPILKKELIKLLYNTLHADFIEPTEFSSNTTIYSSTKGKTLLTERLKVYKASGIVTATQYTNLFSVDSGLGTGQIIIGNAIFKTSPTRRGWSPSDLLGFYVDYYYKEENGDNVLIMALASENKNSSLYIMSDQLISFDGDKLAYQIDQSGKQASARVSKSVSVIYNGRLNTGYNYEDFVPRMGEVSLIDNNNDGVFDVAFINSYMNYFVSTVNSDDMIIVDNESGYAANENSLQINKGVADVIVTVYKNGQTASFSDIKKNSIVSSYKSADSKIYTLVVSEVKDYGTINEKRADGFTQYAVVGNIEYQIGDNYKKTLKPGDMGEVYFDAFGKIAGFKSGAFGKRNFGYLWATGKSSGIDAVTQVEIFTDYGQYKIFEFAENVIVDGIKMKGNDNIVIPAEQIVLYEVNADDRITLIDTPISDLDPENSGENNIFGVEPTALARVYRTRGPCFTNREGLTSVFFSPEVIIFNIPPKGANTEVDYKSQLRVGALTQFRGDESSTVRAYYTDNRRIANVLECATQIPTANYKSNALLVTKKTQLLVEDEQIVKLYGINANNAEFSIRTKTQTLAELMVEKVNPGDMIVYKQNPDGEMEDIVILFNGSSRTVVTSNSYNVSYYGKISKVEGELLHLNDANLTRYFLLREPKVYVFDTVRKNGYTATVGDLHEGQEVFLRINDDIIKEIVVYKTN